MASGPSSETRIVRFLKFRGPQTAETIAKHLAISIPGARKHLSALSEAGLVTHEDESGSVGRPKRHWLLTGEADSHFPDSHAVLTLEMIDSIRSVFGPAGLDRLIGERERLTLERYHGELKGLTRLASRVEKLAELRSKEGYMAEWRKHEDGGYLLVENHCPICAAAMACQGFCRSELAVFRAALGKEAIVERTEHILAGARRCAYRVMPASDVSQ